MEVKEYYENMDRHRVANNFISQIYIAIQDAEADFLDMSRDEIVIDMLDDLLHSIENAQLEKSYQMGLLKDEFNSDGKVEIGFKHEKEELTEKEKEVDTAGKYTKIAKITLGDEEIFVGMDKVELVDFDDGIDKI